MEDTSGEPIKMNITIPEGADLSTIALPNEWVLYLYEKKAYKKLSSKDAFQATPNKKVCTISTVNDLMYILQLMKVKCESKSRIGNISDDRLNLDANDYIIMRKGIEPIWEHVKNENGGTFTVKMAHSKGYDIWSQMLMYMMGETFCHEMDTINGINVTYISDGPVPSTPNAAHTIIKIWDGKKGRTRDEFINILPPSIHARIKDDSIMYSANNMKKDFGERNMMTHHHSNSRDNYRNRGFTNSRRR